MGAIRQRLCSMGRVGIATLVAVSLLMAAAVPLSAHPASKPLPVLRISYGGPPGPVASLDPALVSDPDSAEIVGLVDANLVHILPTDKVAPDLATWKVSRDGLTYTFTIRRNARFANGHAVTAEDARFSLQRALAPPMPEPIGPSYLGLIEGAADFHAGRATTLSGVKVLGDRVLQIRITRPVAYFLLTLAYPAGDVLDPAVVKGKPLGTPPLYRDNYFSNTCAANQGAGPFRLVCRNRSSTLASFSAGPSFTYALEPNPHYYGQKPRVRLELPRLTTVDSYRRYVDHGTLDVSGIFVRFLNRWMGRSKEFHEYPSSTVNYLTPNTHMPPFDNVHCRRAVAYAIDRVSVAAILRYTVQPSYTIVPRGMLGYYPGKDNPHYSLSRARTELARCPGRTVPIELVYAKTSSIADLEFNAMAGMLRAAGMNVKVKPVSLPAWGNIINNPLDQSKTQLVQNGWAQDYPDPQDYCTPLLRSGQPFDIGGWRNVSYDRLVDRAEVEQNRRKRAQLYIQAQHIALDKGAWISLNYRVGQVLVKPYVHGLVGSEAYVHLVPKDLNWANVWVGRH